MSGRTAPGRGDGLDPAPRPGTPGHLTEGTPTMARDRHQARAQMRLAQIAADMRELADEAEALVSEIGRRRADTMPDIRADNRPDIMPDTETVVAALWPPRAVTLWRDVEPRELAAGRVRYNGRVRWIDPDTGKRHSSSRRFDTPEEAWAWVATYTGPAADQGETA